MLQSLHPRGGRTWLGLVVVLAVAFAAVPEAEASHFRGAYVTYEPTGNTNEVEITVVSYWRRSFSAWSGANPGDDIRRDFDINFGDGSPPITFFDPPLNTVTQISAAQDWLVATVTFTHQYPDAGPYTLTLNQCCRIGPLNNRANDDYVFSTLIVPDGSERSANTSAAPFIGVGQGTNITYQLPNNSPDGDPLRCREATPAEAGGGPSIPNMSISTSCLITWDNSTLSTGFWTEQFIIEELDGSGNVKTSIPVDVIFLVDPDVTNTPPVCSFDPAGDINATVGNPVSFDVEGNDADGDVVELSATSLPAGSMMTPALPTSGTGTVSSTFNWTPSTAGTFFASYSLFDGSVNTTCTKTINVKEGTDPVCLDPATEPDFDGEVIRDGNRRLVEFTSGAGLTSIEWYSTTNLKVLDPEDESGAALGFTPSPGPNGGTLFTLDAPAPVVRFPLEPIDPNNPNVAFFIVLTDECGREVDIDPQFALSADDGDMAGLSVSVAPNPAAGRAAVRYALAEPGPATVAVFDALGRQVALLADGPHGSGAHEAVWEAGDAPAGIYVVRVQTGDRVQTVRVTLVR